MRETSVTPNISTCPGSWDIGHVVPTAEFRAIEAALRAANALVKRRADLGLIQTRSDLVDDLSEALEAIPNIDDLKNVWKVQDDQKARRYW